MPPVAPISDPPVAPHQTQFTGSACSPFNCAAATAASALGFTTGGKVRLSPDQFRSQAGASCKPGVDSNSGGLLPKHVISVFKKHGARIDYGNGWNAAGIRRITPNEVKAWLAAGNMVIALGDYGVLKPPYDQQASFNGDHSARGADYDKGDDTVEWDDPIVRSGGRAPVRMPWSQFQKYCETLDDVGHTRGMLVARVEKPKAVATRRVRVDAGSFFIYRLVAGVTVSRRSHNTGGFEQPCTVAARKVGRYNGLFVQVLEGSYKGAWLELGTTGIHYPA